MRGLTATGILLRRARCHGKSWPRETFFQSAPPGGANSTGKGGYLGARFKVTSNLVIVGLIIFDRLVQPGSDLPIALVDFVGDQVISVTTDETGHLDLGMDVLHGLFGASSLMGFTNGPISSGYRAALGNCDRLATLFWPSMGTSTSTCVTLRRSSRPSSSRDALPWPSCLSTVLRRLGWP